MYFNVIYWIYYSEFLHSYFGLSKIPIDWHFILKCSQWTQASPQRGSNPTKHKNSVGGKCHLTSVAQCRKHSCRHPSKDCQLFNFERRTPDLYKNIVFVRGAQRYGVCNSLTLDSHSCVSDSLIPKDGIPLILCIRGISPCCLSTPSHKPLILWWTCIKLPATSRS